MYISAHKHRLSLSPQPHTHTHIPQAAIDSMRVALNLQIFPSVSVIKTFLEKYMAKYNLSFLLCKQTFKKNLPFSSRHPHQLHHVC